MPCLCRLSMPLLVVIANHPLWNAGSASVELLLHLLLRAKTPQPLKLDMPDKNHRFAPENIMVRRLGSANAKVGSATICLEFGNVNV